MTNSGESGLQGVRQVISRVFQHKAQMNLKKLLDASKIDAAAIKLAKEALKAAITACELLAVVKKKGKVKDALKRKAD